MNQAKPMGLRAALRYIRAEAQERAQISTASTNPKGALEVAVIGLWNIEEAAAQALGLAVPDASRIADLKGK